MGPAGRGSRYLVLALLGLLVGLHIVLAWTSRNPGISWGEDDAEYVILGRELLHGSYADRWDVDAPSHARLPPGFPALLSIASVAFGDDARVYTLFVLLCSAASVALFFFVVRRHFGDVVALFVTGLTAINTWAVSDAGYVMAEVPFRFWVTLTLWAASRENPRTRDLVLAGAAAVAAALTRSIGVAVVAGLALHWILERRWKAVALLVVGSIPVGLWFLWTWMAPDPNERSLYLHTLTIGVQETAESTQDAAWLVVVKRTFGSIVEYVRSLVPMALSFPGLRENIIDNLAWAALAVATVPAGLWAAWQRWRLLVLVLFFYGAALAVWPWRYERFVSPITSLLLVLIGAGTVYLLRRRSEGVQRLALAAVAFLFVVGSIQTGLPTLRTMMACDRSRPLDSPACFTDDRRGLLRLAAYARDNTPEDAVFYAPKEGAFYLHSGRRTVMESRFGGVPPDSLGALLRRSGVSYAVFTPIGIDSDRGVSLARACRDFEKVAAFEGDAVLLRLREGGPIDHDDETCQSIAEWKEGRPARWSLR